MCLLDVMLVVTLTSEKTVDNYNMLTCIVNLIIYREISNKLLLILYNVNYSLHLKLACADNSYSSVSSSIAYRDNSYNSINSGMLIETYSVNIVASVCSSIPYSISIVAYSSNTVAGRSR